MIVSLFFRSPIVRRTSPGRVEIEGVGALSPAGGLELAERLHAAISGFAPRRDPGDLVWIVDGPRRRSWVLRTRFSAVRLPRGEMVRLAADLVRESVGNERTAL